MTTSDTDYNSYENYNQSHHLFLAKEQDYYNENTNGYYGGYTYESYPVQNADHQQSYSNYDYNYFCHQHSQQPSCQGSTTECYDGYN